MNGQQYKWRIAHLSPNDATSYNDFVTWFEQAYQANNKPTGMAMFSHNDSTGFTIGVSITPQSVPHCPFSSDWSESATRPDYGHAGWVAGDVRMR
jgi:hypothetical protein